MGKVNAKAGKVLPSYFHKPGNISVSSLHARLKPLQDFFGRRAFLHMFAIIISCLSPQFALHMAPPACPARAPVSPSKGMVSPSLVAKKCRWISKKEFDAGHKHLETCVSVSGRVVHGRTAVSQKPLNVSNSIFLSAQFATLSGLLTGEVCSALCFLTEDTGLSPVAVSLPCPQCVIILL